MPGYREPGKDGLELKSVQFRIKPTLRFIVTRCETWNFPSDSQNAGSDDRRVVECGEFLNIDQAWAVAYALAKQYHELVGWPLGDDRIQYPAMPDQSPYLADPRVKNLVDAALAITTPHDTPRDEVALFAAVAEALIPFRPVASHHG